MTNTAKLFVWVTAGTLALVGGCTVLVLGPCASTIDRWSAESAARTDSVAAARAAARAEADSMKAAEKRAEVRAQAVADSLEDVPGDDLEAQVVCQQFVEARLVSPATADFPANPQVTALPPRGWEVVSYVDSENRFGATLRTNFRCLVEHTGNANYLLMDLQMAER